MGSSAGAIKAGRAFVELFVDDNPAYRALDGFGRKFQAWGASLRNAGAALGAGGGAILAPLLTGLKEATSRASELQQVADRIGEGVEATSTLAGGFERVGVSAEEFGGIVEGLKVRIEQAADAHGYLHEYLKSMGPAFRLSGLDTREQLYAVAEAIQRIPRAINQTRAAKDMGLTPILAQLRRGRAGIDELFAAGTPGAVTSDEGRAALEATQAMTAGWVGFKDAVRQVGMALLPTVEQIKEWKAQISDNIGKVREWVKENRGVIVTAAGVGVGLVAAGVAVVGLGITMAVVGKAIILSVVGIKLAFGLLLAPILSVKGALLALGLGAAYMASQTQTGKAAIGDLRDGIVSFAARAKESFAGISDAVAAGDWTRSWKIGLAALKVEWANFAFYLQIGMNLTGSVFVDTWKDAVAGAKLLFIDLGAFITKCVRDWLNMMGNVVKAMDFGGRGIIGKKVGDGIKGLADGLPTAAQSDAARDAVLSGRTAEQRTANSERDAAARAALRAHNDARRELADLLAGGSSGGIGGLSDLLGGVGGGIAAALRAGTPALGGGMRLADTVKSLGIGQDTMLGQQLAFGDSIPQQQLDAQRNIMSNTADMPQMARDVNVLAQRGRVGA